MKVGTFFTFIYCACWLGGWSQINSPLPQEKEERSVALKHKVKTSWVDEYHVIDNEPKKTNNFLYTHFDRLGNLITKAWGVPQQLDTFKNITEYSYDSEGKLISQKIAQYVNARLQGAVDCSIFEYDGKGNLLKECTPVLEHEQLVKEYCTNYIYKNEKLTQCNTTEGSYFYKYNGDTIKMISENDTVIIQSYYKGHTIYRKYEDNNEYFYYYNLEGRLTQDKVVHGGLIISETNFEYENGLLKRILNKDANLQLTTIQVFTYTFYE